MAIIPFVPSKSSPFLTTALSLAEQGLPVFPCKPDKTPLVASGFKAATTVLSQIQEWANEWPHALVGVPTGLVTGIGVLDIDRKNGVDGFDAIEAAGWDLPVTRTHATCSGGKHLLFKLNGIPFPTRAGTLGPGLDTRGDGGYIIWWPGIGLPVEGQEGMADMPEFLLNLLTKVRGPNGECRHADRLEAGSRNDGLFRLASSLRAKGLSAPSIEAALVEENTVRCYPPLPTEEVRKIAGSVVKYPAGRTATALEHPDPYSGTDYANAELLCARHGEDFQFTETWGKWIHWTGRLWGVDYGGAFSQCATRMNRELYFEAAGEENQGVRKSKASLALKLENSMKISNMMKLAKNLLPAVSIEDLDRDPDLFNCENGTLNLRTGIMHPHRREDYITKQCPVRYNPIALCPEWDRFLLSVFSDNQTMISYFQALLGYSMTGHTSEHCVAICYGHGANGKSTALSTVQGILGPYAITLAQSILMVNRQDRHPTEIADLFGVRMAIASETSEGQRLNEGLLKTLAGEDMIRARRMREDFWQFKPSHKVWLMTNHKPIVRGTDVAIWRRIKLIPFTVTFREKDSPVGPYMDKSLRSKLMAEREGILAWLVEGAAAWYAHPLETPDAVKGATDEYRNEMDAFGQFLEECCIIATSFHSTSSNLYKRYLTFCEEEGERWKMTQTAFGRKLAERGFIKRRTDKSIVWHGLGVKVE